MSTLTPTRFSEKNTKTILIQKFVLFAIFATLCSYFIYPNLFFILSLSEVFGFLALCPEPKIFKDKKSKLNKIVTPGIGLILFLFTLITMPPKQTVPFLILLFFLVSSAVSVKYLKTGTHWLASVSAPILSFIAIEGSRGVLPQILNDTKMFSKNVSFFPRIFPYILSILFLYGLLNLLFFIVKERKSALFVFGFISVILCLANTASVLILKQPFDISQLKVLIEAFKQVENWKTVLTLEVIMTTEFLSTFVFLVLYYPIMSSFIGSLGFISKKEKKIRLLVSVLVIASVILYSRSANVLPETENYLKTFFFALL